MYYAVSGNVRPWDQTGNTEVAEVLRKTEVHVWKVDEDGNRRSLAANCADQPSILSVDERRMPDHLRDAHMGDVFGADDAALACSLHLAASEAEEVDV